MPRSKQNQAALPSDLPLNSEPLIDLQPESSQDALADVLRRLLLAIRCKGMGGQKAPFMVDRCVLCNWPHGTNRPCSCVHHDAAKLLESLGIEVA
jgi:hypothetical protein